MLYAAFNEYDEARFVADRVKHWTEHGGSRREVAILYRSNAQSRVFEETLISMQIPYRVYGGLRFFERAEIKDALGYLRLLARRDDDASFERVINTPPRGIGERTIEVIRGLARERGISLWKAMYHIVAEQRLARRTCNALNTFLTFLDTLEQDTKDLPLSAQVDQVVTRSGLIDMYRKSKDGRGEDRVENLQELVSAARNFESVSAEFVDMEPLSAFLAQAALDAGEGQAGAWEDCVQMMTLHSAKGLEFSMVFLVGLDEDLFPHYLSSREPARLEEERRLAYVGITRARRQLYFSYAEKRRLHGNDIYPRPSRFLREVPAELVRDVRARTVVARPIISKKSTTTVAGNDLILGQRVLHSRFGEGVVVSLEGQGAHTRVQVNFVESGVKWLVLTYAKLQTL